MKEFLTKQGLLKDVGPLVNGLNGEIDRTLVTCVIIALLKYFNKNNKLIVNSIKGYQIIYSTSDLPVSPTEDQQQKGYILVDESVVYVYVKEGNTLGGKWLGIQLGGVEGKSAYDLYLESTTDFPKKSLQEWLNSLKGDKGDTGIGISQVIKTNTSGLIDTYSIVYTNNSLQTFTIRNGKDGGDSEALTLSEIDDIWNDF